MLGRGEARKINYFVTAHGLSVRGNVTGHIFTHLLWARQLFLPMPDLLASRDRPRDHTPIQYLSFFKKYSPLDKYRANKVS
jgi:hypothetical protein